MIGSDAVPVERVNERGAERDVSPPKVERLGLSDSKVSRELPAARPAPVYASRCTSALARGQFSILNSSWSELRVSLQSDWHSGNKLMLHGFLIGAG